MKGQKILKNLKYENFATNLIGCLKGCADYFNLNISSSWLFGVSGHAFLMNIHDEICPSGPYCWNYDPFYNLLANVGLKMVDLGFFHKESDSKDVQEVERIVRNSIDEGNPCIILNMDNQLIVGYDDTKFILKPANIEFNNPPSLTYKTWVEFEKEFHITIFQISQTTPKDDKTAVKEAIQYAINVAKGPAKNYTMEKYTTGLAAYDVWMNAINNDFGDSHGHLWNGTVWAESRHMANRFLFEVGKKFSGKIEEESNKIRMKYKEIAKNLNLARDRELDKKRKIELLKEAQKIEKNCVKDLVSLEKLLN
ncbi:MAG: hypothetical protein KGD65_11375 [Candidatus Lokiarchaeota archaeon]|nr:hypothetical protein [Candidatus Lokiarchaeota archaeon]